MKSRYSKIKSSHKMIQCYLLLTTPIFLFFSSVLDAQETNFHKKQESEIAASKDGHVFLDFRNRKTQKEDMMASLNAYLGLSEQYSFTLLQETKDLLGIEHGAYQQHYRGIPIEEGMLLVHAKEGLLTAVNGQVPKVPEQSSIQPAIEERSAINLAVAALGLEPGYKDPQVSLVFSRRTTSADRTLTYKICLEGKRNDQTYTRMNVFVDALSGKIVNKIDLVAFVATEAKAQTLYSGVQTITTDSYEGGYRLYDSARKITTYNFEKARITSNGQVRNLLDYSNASTTWDEVLALDSVSLLVAGDTALFPSTGNWVPHFHIIAGDSARYFAQGPIADLLRPGTPPARFGNIGLCLTNPSYTGFINAYNLRNRQYGGAASFQIQSTDWGVGMHDWRDSAGNSGQYFITKRPNAALDAHWGMARTYDYYMEIFNRKSYDNRCGAISNFVNGAYATSGTQSQALALGDGLMVFGLGDRYELREVVSLDVMGHEFSHMVIQSNGHGGLAYQGEPGALNESFADIFGACIEFYTKGADANWQIGEDVVLLSPGFLRSMANPKATAVPNGSSVPQPDTYQEQYWADPNAEYDNGGVHINSGVQNKWFYLLCEGGTGTNDKKDDYAVTGIGIKKAEQIAYRNLTTYMTPYAKFKDAYRGSLQATVDLYGEDGVEYQSVKAAWFAVGIDDESTDVTPQLLATQHIRMYPNPASDQVFVTSSLKKATEVAIVNVLGSVVQKMWINPGNNTVDIHALSKGMYFLQFEFNGKSDRLKLSVL